ncbi:MAG: 30S ribosomal protein S13 [Candidatus Micrarchaeota archaeon]
MSEQDAPNAGITPAEEIRGIIRILGRDLKGQLPLKQALTKVKGVGRNLAVSVTRAANRELEIPADAQVGSLSDKQIEGIEEIIRNPTAHGVQAYLVNRNGDMDAGGAKHAAQSDLEFALRQDVEREKMSRSWVGWRKSIGQKVRGQHSRTTGRTGMTVGVLKKAIKAQKESAAKTAQEKAPAKK